MTPAPRIIDPAREADWPAATPPGVRRYLGALAQAGAGRFVANAPGVEVEILRVGETVLPLAVCDGRPGAASMLSPTGHHVHYPVHEIARASGRRGVATLLGLACAPLIGLFRLGALDRVAYVNHWLMVGSPAPAVAPEAWPAIVDAVAARHPRHAVVVVDVRPGQAPELAAALARIGGRAIPTRLTHVIDPSDDPHAPGLRKTRRQRRVMRRDLAAAEADRIAPAALAAQTERLADLYHRSNVARHAALNPHYTAAFFALALGCAQFTIWGWRAPQHDGTRVAGFNLQCDDRSTMHWTAFGAGSAPRRPSYYMLALASDLVRSERTGMVLDWGAGAAEVKRLRGAVPRWQFEVAFTAHLPWRQRLAWWLLGTLRALRLRQQEPDAARLWPGWGGTWPR